MPFAPCNNLIVIFTHALKNNWKKTDKRLTHIAQLVDNDDGKVVLPSLFSNQTSQSPRSEIVLKDVPGVACGLPWGNL